MKNKTRNENFSAIGGRTVNEIRDWVLYEAQNNNTRYNELVKDFEDYIDSCIGIGPDISTAKTETVTQELQPLEPGAIWYYKEFGWMDRNLVFDFITIEPNNSVKVSSLKVSIFWDKEYVSRRDYEKEVERVNSYVYHAIMFRGGCELAITELLEAQQAIEVTTTKNKAEKTFFDFIKNVKDEMLFAEELKSTFNIEEGKNLRIAIDILSLESMISIPEKSMLSFHNSMKKYFGRDIASYESFRKAKDYDSTSIEKMRIKLNPLITKHKK